MGAKHLSGIAFAFGKRSSQSKLFWLLEATFNIRIKIRLQLQFNIKHNKN